MVYNYRLTTSAERELEHEIAYSTDNWGKRHAKSYRHGLYAIIKRIVSNPFAYPLRAEIGEGYRLVRYKGNYIIYVVNESEKYIEIMAFPSVHRDTSSNANH